MNKGKKEGRAEGEFENLLTRLKEDYGLQARVLRMIHPQRGAFR